MCGQEVANSEELQRHRERFHPYPADESERFDEGGEKPDLTAPESEPSEAPEPAQKRR
jgi:hypothetical protein